MNVLDENVPESQRADLRRRHVAIRQIGYDFGRRSMKDREIISLLHGLTRPTFFTLDAGFHNRRLCHKRYCVVHLDVDDEEAAEYVVRLLRHRDLNTWAKRSGCVIRTMPTGVAFWRLGETEQRFVPWQL
jgi:hypothetical protein